MSFFFIHTFDSIGALFQKFINSEVQVVAFLIEVILHYITLCLMET